MLKSIKDPKALRDALLSLLPTSATLAGIGVGLVSIINATPHAKSTVADDILLVSSSGFLAVCYLIFFAMRSIESKHIARYILLIDILFLISLTLVVFSGFAVTYELM